MENKNNRNIIVGSIVVILGSLLLLNNFGFLDFQIKYYLFSWKTLLIVIGLFMLTSRKNLTGGIILISLGVIFWLPALLGHQIVLGQIFLPAILMVIGIIFLLKAGGLDRNKAKKETFVEYEELEIQETTSKEV